MSKFGYINQGNPALIGDNEAQEMVNCKIDRGWLEYGEYKLETGKYESTPGRQVTMPDGRVLQIVSTYRVPNEGNNFASRGQVMSYDPNSTPTHKQIHIPAPTDGCLSYINPANLGANRDTGYGAVVAQPGIFRYVVPISAAVDRYIPIDYDDRHCVLSEIRYGGKILSPGEYIIYAGSGAEAGKAVVVLSFNPGIAEAIQLYFHVYNDEQLDTLHSEPGKYFYAFTYYDPATKTESPPYYKETFVTNKLVSDMGHVHFAIGGLKVETSVLSDFPNARIRVYRMPYGGSEYLFDTERNPGVLGETFIDPNADHQLGYVLPTEGNTNVPLDSKDVVSMTTHKDRLFIAMDVILGDSIPGGFVYFSKAGLWDEFPAKNFFFFPDRPVAMAQVNEQLAILTKSSIYVLYGADEDSFSMSKIDFIGATNADSWKATFGINTAQAIAGTLFALNKSTNKKTDAFLIFNSRFAVDASLPIRDLLDVEGCYGTGAVYDSRNASNRNAVLDNRFYVFEQLVSQHATEPLSRNIVFDSILRGFCVYDPAYKDDATELFKWRSKEYDVDGRVQGVQFHKRLYVRGKGKFKAEILGDGQLITTYGFDNNTLTTDFFPIQSVRYSTISIRFVGEKGAQIHDWGIVSDGHD